MKNVITLLAICVLLGFSIVQAQTVIHPQMDLFQSSKSPGYSVPSLSLSNEIQSGRKNIGLAVLYSLLVPGLGELYVGEYGVGKFFTIAEATLWLTFTSFELYGTWLRDDARQFAISRANVNLAGKDDQYFVDIGNFINIYEYNEKKLRDRDIEKLYDVSTHYWQWDNDANRVSYRQLRISHDQVFNNNRFVVAAIIVNHIASAVNAGRLAIGHNRRLQQSSLFQIHATVIGGLQNPHGIMVSVSKSF